MPRRCRPRRKASPTTRVRPSRRAYQQQQYKEQPGIQLCATGSVHHSNHLLDESMPRLPEHSVRGASGCCKECVKILRRSSSQPGRRRIRRPGPPYCINPPLLLEYHVSDNSAFFNMPSGQGGGGCVICQENALTVDFQACVRGIRFCVSQPGVVLAEKKRRYCK